MKSTKGFTLVELLAVLTLLALIALISVPAITGSLKSYKNSLYDDQIKNIEKAARVWASDNMLIIPSNSSVEKKCYYDEIDECDEDYNKLIITLRLLQDNGYIDPNLKSVKTKNEFSDMEIVIKKSGNKLEFNVIDQEFFVYKIGDIVTVKLSNNITEEFIVIKDSDERDTNVELIKREPINNDMITWCSTCGSNNEQPIEINEKLSELNWDNTIEKRLIEKSEIENIETKLINNSAQDKSWIYGNYWTKTPYGTNQVYYVNNSGTAFDLMTNTHKIRPVISIKKTYVKYIQ